MSRWALPLCVGFLACPIAGAIEGPSRRKPSSVDASVSPLRVLSTTRISQGGLVAWTNPTRCDQDGNVHLLLAPHAKPSEIEEAARAGRDLPLAPRQVLRLSADGKNRTVFDPAASAKLADAASLTTVAMTTDELGTVYLLVWATRRSAGGQAERGGQYVVSIGPRGKVRSEVEVDWREMLVRQFEVFGSGEFLLRGSRTDSDEERVAILSASGGDLRSVAGWSGQPVALVEEPSEGGVVHFDHMVRGADGRVYFAEQDARQGAVVIHAFAASGDSETLFELQPMPKDRQLLGFLSAAGRIAATYQEAGPPRDGPAGEQRGRWWIAVYDLGSGGEGPLVYGPAPGPPVCYQRGGSQDVFTFLTDGDTLVTMTP